MPLVSEQSALDALLGQCIVVDLRSSYVCIGTLTRVEETLLELTDADLHDFRDGQATRERYIADTRFSGIKRNRKRVLVTRAEVVAVSLLEDVVEE